MTEPVDQLGEIERARTKRAPDIGKSVLAALVVLAFIGVCYIIVLRLAPRASGELLMFIGTMVGYLAAMAQTVVNYFFGSSQGATASREALNAAVKQAGK